ncbi:hypothetical protein [Gulbenkiania indica]|uniref:hypothetical protein n=1 Tax=Gulbenkiania indica TaxID=375574 RepID=UPI001B809E55|nr:hypothetical protein [Gulbenkiania indica]
MWVAQQMGHKDWGMIRRVYGRWMQDMEQRAGAKAVERFARKKADQKADHTAQKNPKNQPKSA